MMYHAESFVANGFETYFIGYRGPYYLPPVKRAMLIISGSKVIPSLITQPHVRLLYLSDPPARFPMLPFILTAPIKVFHQSMTILAALLMRIPHPPEFIMVQVHLDFAGTTSDPLK
jgi:beta-1,4-mannosyltransferase